MSLTRPTRPPNTDDDLHEDARVQAAGFAATRLGKTVGIVTDGGPEKAGRYVAKLLDRFPGIELRYFGPGPAAGMTSVVVGPNTRNN